MKIQTFSVIVGTVACNASCPFCISRMTGIKDVGLNGKIDWRNFGKACRLAQLGGASSVIITGKGEPTLYPQQITQCLRLLKKYDFPIIELQTNGIVLEQQWEVYRKYLAEWYRLGLGLIAISIVHYDPGINGRIYLAKSGAKLTGRGDEGVTLGENVFCHPEEPACRQAGLATKDLWRFQVEEGILLRQKPDQNDGKGYINMKSLIEKLHKIGYSVRLTCTLFKGGIDTPKKAREMVLTAKKWSAEQLSLRPVARPIVAEDIKAYRWVGENQLSTSQIKNINGYFENNGHKLITYGHGSVLYDFEGQNVCITNALTIKPEADDIRQIIYFPDGHIRFDWQYEGAVIL